MKYLVLSPDDEPVFNTDSQSIFASSIDFAKESIEEDLDEPTAEDLDTGEILTKRVEGYRFKGYKIYKLKGVK